MKKIHYVLILAIVLIVGGVGLYFYMGSQQVSVDDLLVINTKLEFSEIEQADYEEIKTLLLDEPGNYSGQFRLANLKQRKLDYNGAVNIYKDLLVKKPGDILVLNNLGIIYYDTKRFEDSEEQFLKIMDISKKWMNAYRRSTDIYRYHLTSKQDNIEDLLLLGLERNPEAKLDFYGQLAIYYDEIADDKDNAVKYLELVVGLDPSNTGAVQRLGELK